ncbi:hypothetical protein [Oribacterium sp. FC2011]|uniref:hypothetical protein n=1 Tax=Oribacterium sp. FC2011 TaxID=1408311 RepID=UPI0004E0D4D7|nr:hypothetical protein [Oribacterium sp. FC2011]
MEKMKSITEKRDAKREEDERVLAELWEEYSKVADEVHAIYNRDEIRIKAGQEGMTFEEMIALNRRVSEKKLAYEREYTKRIPYEERLENERQRMRLLMQCLAAEKERREQGLTTEEDREEDEYWEKLYKEHPEYKDAAEYGYEELTEEEKEAESQKITNTLIALNPELEEKYRIQEQVLQELKNGLL